jgi:hypothetical protein
MSSIGGVDITFSAVCSNRKVRSIYLPFLYSFRCSPCTHHVPLQAQARYHGARGAREAGDPRQNREKISSTLDITFSAVCSNRKVRSIYLPFLYSFRCSPCTSNRYVPLQAQARYHGARGAREAGDPRQNREKISSTWGTFSAVCSNRKVRSIYLPFLYSFRCSPCTSNR